jgi:hypothetical protein
MLTFLIFDTYSVIQLFWLWRILAHSSEAHKTHTKSYYYKMQLHSHMQDVGNLQIQLCICLWRQEKGVRRVVSVTFQKHKQWKMCYTISISAHITFQLMALISQNYYLMQSTLSNNISRDPANSIVHMLVEERKGS